MRDFFNPRVRTGMRLHDYAHAAVTLVAIIALVALGFGAGYKTAAHRYTEHYFVTHYAHLGLALPQLPGAVNIEVPIPRALPATVSLNEKALVPVQNQQQEGACAGVSDAEAIGYRVRLTNPKHPGIKYSWQFLYSWYIDAYAGGQDTGSDPVHDVDVVSSLGVPQLSYWTIGNRSPFPTAATDPAMFANAGRWRLPVTVRTLYEGQPSDAVYQEAIAAISEGQVAIIGINVTPSFDAAWASGRVWLDPQNPIESNRGAHAIIAWRAPGVTMPDGSPALELRNSWSTAWGNHGDVLVSEKWLSQNSWAVWELQGI